MFEKRPRLARWLGGHGIEIGALHQPLELPAEVQVTYVDHLTVEGLRHHYPELREVNLVPVSVIGSAQDLCFADNSLDFVIANHLLEHMEYPIKALLEFQRVLRPGGVLYLALPDKRRTFDRKRELTTVQHLVEEQRYGLAERNRRAHYLDWAEHVDGKAPGAPTDSHADALMAIPYSIHFHVWRPDTFLDFLAAARGEFSLELQTLQFAALEDSEDFEFVILLAKADGDQPVLPVRADPTATRPETPQPASPDVDDEHGALHEEPAPLARAATGPAWLREAVRNTPFEPPLRAVKRRLRL